MSSTFTVGVFQDAAWAERGIRALLAAGFSPASISVVAKQSPAVEALVSEILGAAPATVDLKTLGAATAHGPIIGALDGADDGLRNAGLAATIGRAGFQAHDGYIYETLTGRGGVLVAVHSEPRAADALAKLHAYGGGNAAIGAWAGRV